MFDLFKRAKRHEEPEYVNPADAARERALEEVEDVLGRLSSAHYELQRATRGAQTALGRDWAESIQQQANRVEDMVMTLDHHCDTLQRELS